MLEGQQKRSRYKGYISISDLKLAESIQAQPSLTTHLATFSSAVPARGGGLEVHGIVLSGSRKPLSRANCSRQMGRKRVRETIAKASLANA